MSEDQLCSATCCGQTENGPTLTIRITDDVGMLRNQMGHVRELVNKLRDVLGIYHMPAIIGGSEAKQCSEPTRTQPSITDAEREMRRIISAYDLLISNIEDLLKNL